MASTYTDNLGFEKIGAGEQSGTWGVTTNTNFNLLDQGICGYAAISLAGVNVYTLTVTDGALSDGRSRVLKFTGAPSGNVTITIDPNNAERFYFIINATTGNKTLTFTQGAGGSYTVGDLKSAVIHCDGGGAGAIVSGTLVDLQATTFSVVDSAGATEIKAYTSGGVRYLDLLNVANTYAQLYGGAAGSGLTLGDGAGNTRATFASATNIAQMNLTPVGLGSSVLCTATNTYSQVRVYGTGASYADLYSSASSYLAIDGSKVVGARGAAIADLAGGATLADAITAINTILARLRAATGHGLIA